MNQMYEQGYEILKFIFALTVLKPNGCTYMTLSSLVIDPDVFNRICMFGKHCKNFHHDVYI